MVKHLVIEEFGQNIKNSVDELRKDNFPEQLIITQAFGLVAKIYIEQLASQIKVLEERLIKLEDHLF